MNVFVLDQDPGIAASYMCNKHVVKMPLETAQILCTVARSRGFEAPYRSTHIHHPVVLWVALSSANWNWLCSHGIALCHEYTLRYGKVHKCQSIIEGMEKQTFQIWNENLDLHQHTPFMQCMPDIYKVENDAVAAYRAYYCGDKKEFAKWTSPRTTPEWFK